MDSDDESLCSLSLSLFQIREELMKHQILGSVCTPLRRTWLDFFSFAWCSKCSASYTGRPGTHVDVARDKRQPERRERKKRDSRCVSFS